MIDHSLNVMINGKLIEQVQHAKLLGVTLDCHLTWEKHIENICSIVNSSRFSIITVLYVSSSLVFITSLSIVRVHGVIVPIIYCLVFFSIKNVQLDCSLMPTILSTIGKLIFQTQMAAYFRPYKTKKTCTFIHYS